MRSPLENDIYHLFEYIVMNSMASFIHFQMRIGDYFKDVGVIFMRMFVLFSNNRDVPT